MADTLNGNKVINTGSRADYTNRGSPNFAELLVENANNGVEILSVLDDIVEVEDTAL